MSLWTYVNIYDDSAKKFEEIPCEPIHAYSLSIVNVSQRLARIVRVRATYFAKAVEQNSSSSRCKISPFPQIY